MNGVRCGGANRGKFIGTVRLFRAFGIKIINNLTSMDLETILYHYTTVFGFNEIVNSSSIWASDCRYLNDRHELERAVSIFIKEYDGSENKALTLACSFHNFINCHCIFSLSMSPEVLSQWRAYGDDGRGIAIGFNSKYLPHSHAKVNKSQKPALVECIYENHVDFIRKIINEKSHEISKIIGIYKESKAANTFMDNLRQNPAPLNRLFDELLRVKNNAFIEEQEVRLVFHVPFSEIKTRVSNGLIVPYFNYHITDEGDKDSFFLPKYGSVQSVMKEMLML